MTFIINYCLLDSVCISMQPKYLCRFLTDRSLQYQRMIGTLTQCDFSMAKTLQVYDMNLKEMGNYEQIYRDIGKIHYCTVE